MSYHPRWIALESTEQLSDSLRLSQSRTQVYFKHSTRCIISKMVLKQLEDNIDEIPASTDLYLLDLLAHRDISNALATQLHVHHESPQVIVVNQEQAVYHESHHSIAAEEIAKHCA
jgi:bacillithiol system protein YtxJ